METGRVARLAGAVCLLAATLGFAASAPSSPARHVRLRVDGAGKLVDAPLGLRIGGAAPGERVVVRVEARDAHRTRRRSRATFVTDPQGVEITVSAAGRRLARRRVRRLTSGKGVTTRTLLPTTVGVYGRYYAPAPKQRQADRVSC